MYPEGYRYTKEHEWLKVEGEIVTVGITHHAQDQLGDIVYVELPDVGSEFDKGDEFGSVESVKAVAEVFMPISGEVVEVNEDLEDSPEQVNSAPHDAGWILKLKMSDASELDELMDAAAYEAFVAAESE